MKFFFTVLMALLFVVPAPANLRDRIKARIVEKEKAKSPPKTQEQPKTITAAGDYTFKLTVNGKDRFYKLHVPKKYSSDRPAALLLALHGGGGDMNIQSTEEYYHQISKSESEGFVALFPNGVSEFPTGRLATWNAGKCCGLARDNKVDDVTFIKDMVLKTQSQMNIDAKRIFATGISNGAMMVYRLACELPEMFRAIAPVAGTDNTIACDPPRKAVSVLHIHAKNDSHVLFHGGAGTDAFKDRSKVTEFSSVPSSIDKWRTIDGCEEKPKRILEKKGVSCDRYESCKEGTRVQLCVTEDGGHSWPGGKKPRFTDSKDKPSSVISANDVMWEFFNSL